MFSVTFTIRDGICIFQSMQYCNIPVLILFVGKVDGEHWCGRKRAILEQIKSEQIPVHNLHGSDPTVHHLTALAYEYKNMTMISIASFSQF